MNDNGRGEISFDQQLVETPRLFDGARVAVEQETAPAVLLLNTRTQSGVDQVVGDQSAGGDDGLGFQTERRTRGDLRTEHIARRYGGNRVPKALRQPINDQAALRPFTRPWRAKQK